MSDLLNFINRINTTYKILFTYAGIIAFRFSNIESTTLGSVHFGKSSRYIKTLNCAIKNRFFYKRNQKFVLLSMNKC